MKRNILSPSRIVLLAAAALLSAGSVNAQSLLRGVANAAKNKVEQKVVGAVTDAAGRAVKGKKNKDTNVESTVLPTETEQPSTGITEEDLPVAPGKLGGNTPAPVGGSMAIFKDTFADSPVGQVPSKWNILDGEGFKVVNFKGDNVLQFPKMGTIAPVAAEENYLPEAFTIDFDIWTVVPNGDLSCANTLTVYLYNADWAHACEQSVKPCTVGNCGFLEDWQMWYEDPNGESLDAECSWENATKWMKPNTWTHITMDYNRGDYKFCINGNCVISASGMAQPAYVNLYAVQYEDQEPTRIKNFVIMEQHR